MANYAGGSVVWDLDVKTEKLKLGLSEASRQVADTARETGKTVQKMGDNFTDIGKKLSIGLTAPIAGITGIGMSLVTVAGRYNSVADSFRSMTRDMGIDAKEFERSVSRATGGQIDNLTILQSATRGLALIGKDAFNNFGEDFVKMAELSKKAARSTGQDVDFMFESLILGIARESKMILDNLGVNVDIIAAKDEYAKSLGKTRDELTQSEEKHAVLNKAMLQLEDTYGNVAVSAGGFGGAWQELTTLLTNTRIEIGQKLEPAFAELTKTLAIDLREIIPIITEVVTKLANAFAGLSPETRKAIIAVSALFALIGPLFLLVGSSLSAISGVIAAVFNPIFLAIAAIAGSVAGVIYLIGRLKGEVEKFSVLFSAFKVDVLSKVKKSVEDITVSIERLAEVFSIHFENIKKRANGLAEAFSVSFGNMVASQDVWERDVLVGFAITLANIHDTIWNTLIDISLRWGKELDAIVSSVKSWGSDIYIAIVQAMIDFGVAVDSGLRNIWAGFDQWITDTVVAIDNWGRETKDSLKISLDGWLLAFNNWWYSLGKSEEPVVAGEEIVKRTTRGMWQQANKIETLRLISELIAGILIGGVALLALGFISIGFRILKGIYDGLLASRRWLGDRVGEIFYIMVEKITAIDWYKLGRDIITSISNGLRDFAATTLNGTVDKVRGTLEKLNPWSRNSPSLIDNIRSGVRTINKEYEKLQTPNFASFGNMFENEVIAQRPVTINNSMTVQRESDMDAFSRRLSFEAQII